jgi:type I restriction enzyme S subunit
MKCLIKDLGKVSTGNTPSKKEEGFYDSDDIGFVKPDIISDSKITYVEDTQEYLSENARKKARIVPANSVFVTCIGSIGKIGIAKNREFAFNQQINAIEPNEKVFPEYLAYCLMYNKKQLTDIANAPVVPIINKTQFESFEISIEEDVKKQAVIVGILNQVIEIIHKRQQQLEQLELLIQSRFVEMFGDPSINPMGWDRVNISEVVGGKVSNGFFAKRDDYVETGNVSVMGVAYIVNRMYSQWQGLPRTNGMDKDIEKFEVKYGDMLFCRSSLVAEGIGKASIVPEDVPKNTLFECHVIRLPLDLNKCVPEYMQVLSTMDFFRRQVIAQSKTATMTTIGQDGILKTDILLPSIDKQREFYDFVREIEKSKLAVQKALDETQLLFDSLMQEYFG